MEIAIPRWARITAVVLVAAAFALTTLKLMGAITWPWWMVLLPLLPIPVVAVGLVALLIWAVLCWMASGSH